MPNEAGFKQLAQDMWWFIENVNGETPGRTERFFALRERYRHLLVAADAMDALTELTKADEEAKATPELDAKYRALAKEEYEVEGEIEIDDNAKISYGDDNGAYVQAWVWVEDPEGGEVHDPDLCDICFQSGVEIDHTTNDGRTVCMACAGAVREV